MISSFKSYQSENTNGTDNLISHEKNTENLNKTLRIVAALLGLFALALSYSNFKLGVSPKDVKQQKMNFEPRARSELHQDLINFRSRGRGGGGSSKDEDIEDLSPEELAAKEIEEKYKQAAKAAEEAEKAQKEAAKKAAEEAEEAAKVAEKVAINPMYMFNSRVEALPSLYKPAVDYEDPCDAVRIDCCTDDNFPVLGGMDVVHFRLTGQIQFGTEKYKSTIETFTKKYEFWFYEKAAVDVFNADPTAYLPGWGGFDCGQFCSSGGGLYPLMSKTVELVNATLIDNKIAFSSNVVDNPTACANAFNSFYGSPFNGVFNTRCVSMAGFNSSTVSGLLATMPEEAIPVKMSEIYGVLPGIPVGEKTKVYVSSVGQVPGQGFSHAKILNPQHARI